MSTTASNNNDVRLNAAVGDLRLKVCTANVGLNSTGSTTGLFRARNYFLELVAYIAKLIKELFGIDLKIGSTFVPTPVPSQ